MCIRDSTRPVRCIQRGDDLTDVVAVRHIDQIQAEGAQFARKIAQAHHLVVTPVDLQSIPVHQNGQVVKTIMGGGHQRLPHHALLAFSVADERIDLLRSALALDVYKRQGCAGARPQRPLHIAQIEHRVCLDAAFQRMPVVAHCEKLCCHLFKPFLI